MDPLHGKRPILISDLLNIQTVSPLMVRRSKGAQALENKKLLLP